jgi:hypothetical protein
MRRGVIIAAVAVVVLVAVVVAIVLFNWRVGGRVDHGRGPLPDSYLTDPTSEEQLRSCEGVGGQQPIVRLTAPVEIVSMILCEPTQGDTADPMTVELVPRVIKRTDSPEADAALAQWSRTWTDQDQLPYGWESVACTGELRIGPSFTVTTIDGMTVRPVAPLGGCQRPTAAADDAMAAVMNL